MRAIIMGKVIVFIFLERYLLDQVQLDLERTSLILIAYLALEAMILKNKSIKSSPSRVPKLNQGNMRRSSRFESPRNSLVSNTNTLPEMKEKIRKPK